MLGAWQLGDIVCCGGRIVIGPVAEDVFHRCELIAPCHILTPAECGLSIAATPSGFEPVKGAAPLWAGGHGKNAPPKGCKVRGLASLNLFDEPLKFI
jgi:hypothetical protein